MALDKRSGRVLWRASVSQGDPDAWTHSRDTHAGPGVAAYGSVIVVEVGTVRQYCTSVSVRFDDAAVADFFDQQVDAGRRPAEFARLWLHTHPASWAHPSGTDEETFGRCLGGADWSVMSVLARGG